MYIQSIHITSHEKYLNTRRRIKVPSVGASCNGRQKKSINNESLYRTHEEHGYCYHKNGNKDCSLPNIIEQMKVGWYYSIAQQY